MRGETTKFLLNVVVSGYCCADYTQWHTHSVQLLWTRDQTVAETSTWQRETFTTDRHPCPPAGFVPAYPSKRAVADSRLRPRGHQHRLFEFLTSKIINISCLYSRTRL